MKQNKNSSAIRLLSFLTALVVFAFSLSVPSFAYTDTSTNGVDFSNLPLPITSSESDMLYLFQTSRYNDTIKGGSSIADTYAFIAPNPGNNNTWMYLFVCARVSSSFTWYYYDGSSVKTKTASDGITINDTVYKYGYGQYWLPDYAPHDADIPQFSSLSDGLNAVADWLDNPPVPLPDPQGPLNISIPCGNALFIDISDLTGLTGSLSTQTTQSHSSPFSWNSTLSYTDSVPTSGAPVGNSINWVGTGGTDVFGRYRSWTCNLIVQPNKKYIAITNPFFNSEYLDPEHEDTNFPITVSLSNYRDYFFVPLNAQYVNGEGVQNSYTDEQTQAPTPGGNNTTTTGNSINDFLQNIASSISGFFQGAIGAVSTLVSAGADFMRSVSGLYMWLPAPVYTVLTSAIILVITIGVIKVFI